MSERMFVLSIPECPKSVNRKGGGVGAHHFIAHREKKRWEQLYLTELWIAKVPKAMLSVRVAITVRWKRRNHQERENYRHPVIKPLGDALMIGGYLADDADEFFEVVSFDFEFPTSWPHSDPRRKAELWVALQATY